MGKESFIIYSSFYKPISKLSDKQLGRLFRAIFAYHIDGAVTVEEDIEMAFAFFVNQFEIDESKYQCKVERNRESGRKGGLTKANRDTAEGFDDDGERLKSKQTLKTLSETSERLKSKQTLKTLSLNDNDNDNVNDNVNESSSTTDAHTREGTAAGGEVDSISKFLDDFFKDQAAVEAFCMNNHVAPEKFRKIAEEITTEWKLTGQTHTDAQDARRHLLNQARIKIHRTKTNEAKPNDRYAKRRGADSAAIRPEDYTGEI